MRRGRPPVFAESERQLLIELRRLTGCSVDRLLSELTDAGYPRPLPKKSQARLWAPAEGLVVSRPDLGLDRASMRFKPPASKRGKERRGLDRDPPAEPRPRVVLDSGRVKKVIVHVVPVLGGKSDEGELALLWEPASRLLLGKVARTFEGQRLVSFVATCLRRLPRELTHHIKEVQCTKPSSGGSFWYEFDEEPLDRRLWPPGSDCPSIKMQRPTEYYGPIDFGPLLAASGHGTISECVGRLLDAYNLDRGLAQLNWVQRSLVGEYVRILEAAGPLARIHELLDQKKSPSTIARNLRSRVSGAGG